jgi:hypothetical protein
LDVGQKARQHELLGFATSVRPLLFFGVVLPLHFYVPLRELHSVDVGLVPREDSIKRKNAETQKSQQQKEKGEAGRRKNYKNDDQRHVLLVFKSSLEKKKLSGSRQEKRAAVDKPALD